MKRRIALGLFLCLALVQLAVPASMIVRRELTLHSGGSIASRRPQLIRMILFGGATWP